MEVCLVSNEFEGMWKEGVMIPLEVLSQHLAVATEEHNLFKPSVKLAGVSMKTQN